MGQNRRRGNHRRRHPRNLATIRGRVYRRCPHRRGREETKMRAGPPLLLIPILLVGLALRSLFAAEVFNGERMVAPWDPDTSYHLWRIEETVRTGVPPHWDRLLNAPIGAAVPYPDGFAALCAGVARLQYGTQATRHQIQLAANNTMPVLGLLAILVVYFLTRRIFGSAAALVAAGFAAVLPGHALQSSFGRVDHHVFEIALPSLALLAILSAQQAKQALQVVVCGLLAGVALAALHFAVTAAPLHMGLVGGAAVVAALRGVQMGQPAAAAATLRATAVAFAMTALLCGPDALRRGGFAYYEASALSTVHAAAGALAAIALAHLVPRGLKCLLGASGVAALLAVVVLALLLPGAAQFVGRSGALALVEESEPAWFAPGELLGLWSLALPVVPIALVWLARQKGSPDAWALAALGLSGCVLMLLQMRFGVVLAVPGAAALAAVLVTAWRRARLGGRIALTALSLVALVPSAQVYANMTLLTRAGLATLDASEWLAAHTPPVGSRSTHGSVPYTVLALWDAGPHIAYLAERPVLAGAFYHGAHADSFADTAAMLFGDPPQRGALLDRRRVRYVVLQPQDTGTTPAHRALLGLPPTRLPTLQGQLFGHDGSASASQPALPQFRLRHDCGFPAGLPNKRIPACKIFERVAGAILHGSCSGSTVQVRMPQQSDAGRAFVYTAETTCHAGQFQLHVPYPGHADIASAALLPRRVTVSESDVEQGRTVTVAP